MISRFAHPPWNKNGLDFINISDRYLEMGRQENFDNIINGNEIKQENI